MLVASDKRGRGCIGVGVMLLAAFAIGLAVDVLMASRAANPSPDPNGVAASGGLFDRPVDWDYWLDLNPDVVAWIEVPGTSISQPVVQASADDPTYYLTHDVRRDWNCFGCPYVDAGCDRGVDSASTVISGHNITIPPSMFHEVAEFHDPEYLANHGEIVVYTPAATKRLKVIGSRTVAACEAEKVTGFSSELDFRSWRNSLFADLGYDGEREGVGQVVTLCSCSYYFNPADERTLVYAV